MANPSLDVVIERIRRLPDYAGLFEEAFGEGVGARTIGQAISTYERTLLAADSAFDRWRYGGDDDALGPLARQGFDLYSPARPDASPATFSTNARRCSPTTCSTTTVWAGFRHATSAPGA